MSETPYYQRSRAKDYYESNKELLRERESKK